MPRQRGRRGSLGQGCRQQTDRGYVRSRTQPREELAPPVHNCNQQRPPVVRRGKQPPPRSKEPAPASNPMPPPAGTIPRPASRHVAAAFNSCRRRSHACGDRRASRSCATGKHDRPAQSKRIAGTRVSPANRPRLCRVHHVAEPRARATNAQLPPATRASNEPRQAAAATLQGAGFDSEPDATTGWANSQVGVRLGRHHL